MAIATWPLSLPDFPLHDGYNRTTKSNVISDPDGKSYIELRRRTSLKIYDHAVSYSMSKTQVSTFIGFYDGTLGHGSLPYTIPNPITQTGTIKVRIKSSNNSAYEIVYDEDTNDYLVSFILEELPS
jgi:hypothetical protein